MNETEARIISIIDEHAEELQAMAEDIFHHAEQGYHEYRTAGIAAEYLKKLGLDVKTGLAITGLRGSSRGK